MRKIRRARRRRPQPEADASEKRVFSRIECLVDLELTEEATEVKPGEGSAEEVEAIDLSLLGLGFQRDVSREPLPLGKTVSVGLYGFQPVQAKVRWNDGSRVGVQFCGRLQDILESWVGDVLAAQGVRLGDLFDVRSL